MLRLDIRNPLLGHDAGLAPPRGIPLEIGTGIGTGIVIAIGNEIRIFLPTPHLRLLFVLIVAVPVILLPCAGQLIPSFVTRCVLSSGTAVRNFAVSQLLDLLSLLRTRQFTTPRPQLLLK